MFSVDPQGCRDIDDAMSVCCLGIEEGTCIENESYRWVKCEYEVGVHIADVAAYVPVNSSLDKEAQSRGTTVYLPHRRIDMLPSALSSDIASLHCGVDRLAVSVLWRYEIMVKVPLKATKYSDRSKVKWTRWSTVENVQENLLALYELGDVQVRCKGCSSSTGTTSGSSPVDGPECHPPLESVPDAEWMGRTVIHSAASMTYEQAHNLLNPNDLLSLGKEVGKGVAGQPLVPTNTGRLYQSLQLLTIISRELMRTRKAGGSLDLIRLTI